ncbi:BTAD domain-containing putative transcriptional regulator [Nocardia sp. NPDC056100]|uniref:BTAD domain-containing putative transcriptional regulator n=1 Tax=Nocardia sp. NPDC056100 TaxID=3345712 RepID=UPI0035E38295
MSAANIQITLLDGVQVRLDDRAVALGPPQRRSLLAMLAMRRRRWVAATALLDGLYDDAAPASGIGLVQTHISALRRALEPDRAPRAAPTVLLSGHGGYQLNITDEQIDVGVFDRLVSEAERARAQGDPAIADERYTRALLLCSGEPLAGAPGPVVAAHRALLHERALAVLEDSLYVALDLGRTDQVVDRVRPLVSEHPLRERPSALLMRGLARQGRRAEALDVYARTRRRLVDELGVEPGDELRELQSRILAGQAEPAIAPARSVRGPIPDPLAAAQGSAAGVAGAPSMGSELSRESAAGSQLAAGERLPGSGRGGPVGDEMRSLVSGPVGDETRSLVSGSVGDEMQPLVSGPTGISADRTRSAGWDRSAVSTATAGSLSPAAHPGGVGPEQFSRGHGAAAAFSVESASVAMLSDWSAGGSLAAVVPSEDAAAYTRLAHSGVALLDRDEQLAAIFGAYQRAMSGRGGTVVISGYPGSGKTVLIEAVAERVPNAVVLNAKELVGPEPRLFHELARLAGMDTATAGIEDTDYRGQAALLRDGFASQPWVLLLDDVAEAGTPSLELLVALTPQLRTLPVLVVAVFDERTWYLAPVSSVHTELECLAAEVIRLAGLRLPAISALAARALGGSCSDTLALEIQQATGGLPILVGALLKDLALLDAPRHVPEQLPSGTYQRAMRRLLNRYSRDGGAMLRAIAVLQDYRAPVEVVAAACEQPEAEIRERCSLLVTEGILAAADPPRFRHRLPANTLRHLCPRAEVRQVRELAAQRALLLSRDTREVAAYLLELSGPQWSYWVPTLIDAAAEAVRALDLAEATGYLEVAQRISVPEQRSDLALRLGLLKQWTDPVAARAYLEQALALERESKTAPAALIPLAWTLITAYRATEADALLDQVLAETAARDQEAATSVRASRWMVAALTSQGWSSYRELARHDPRPDVVTAATRTLDDVFAVRISAEAARARFLPASGVQPHERLPRELFGIFAHIALWTDELTLTAQLSAQSEDKYFGVIDAYRLILRSEALLRQGRYADAERECALIAATPTGTLVRRPPALVAQYAHALLGSGRLDEADEWLESTRAHTNPESWEWTTITYVRALSCVARNRHREAVAHFLECGRRLAAWDLHNPAHIPWRSSAALQLIPLGDHAQARQLAAEELELAQRWNTPVTLGRAWRAVAMAAADATTIPLLHTAITHLRRGESATELIRALEDLADIHTAEAAFVEARTALREAHDIAISRGAALFATRISARLSELPES